MPQCDPINSGRKYHNETFFLNDHIETLKDHIEILKKKKNLIEIFRNERI